MPPHPLQFTGHKYARRRKEPTQYNGAEPSVKNSMAVLAFHPDNLEHVAVIFEGFECFYESKKYLVFSSDELLLVERCREYHGRSNWVVASDLIETLMETNCTKAFRVYKINVQMEEGDLELPSWTRLNHLSGRCLMLGNNHSVSLSPEQVPGLKGNCIYFTDDYPDNLSEHYTNHPRDVGVYNMELDTFDRFLADYSSYNWPPPICAKDAMNLFLQMACILRQ